MIRRVYGKANDLDILFEKTEDEELWKAIIPQSASGSYYLDLYAEDYVGNVAFIATALFEVDVNQLCVKFLIVEYREESLVKEFIEKLSAQNSIHFEDELYYEEILINDYRLEVINSCCL